MTNQAIKRALDQAHNLTACAETTAPCGNNENVVLVYTTLVTLFDQFVHTATFGQKQEEIKDLFQSILQFAMVSEDHRRRAARMMTNFETMTRTMLSSTHPLLGLDIHDDVLGDILQALRTYTRD